MRISNNTITRNNLANLQLGLSRMIAAQEEASSGKRIQRTADDPVGASSVMRNTSSLRALDQYKRNMGGAQARLAAEESVLNSITDTLSRAKELGLGTAGSSASPAGRIAAKAEVDQILAGALALGNSQHEGEYLFGGNASTTAPFQGPTPPFAAAAPTGVRQTEISPSQLLTANHNGTEVFLDTNVLGALQQLSAALGANDSPGIALSLTALDSAHAAVQSLLGETGARANQIDVGIVDLEALDTQLRTLNSNTEDADIERAVTELVSRQTAYQAALLATSRIMGLNLADYLR